LHLAAPQRHIAGSSSPRLPASLPSSVLSSPCCSAFLDGSPNGGETLVNLSLSVLIVAGNCLSRNTLLSPPHLHLATVPPQPLFFSFSFGCPSGSDVVYSPLFAHLLKSNASSNRMDVRWIVPFSPLSFLLSIWGSDIDPLRNSPEITFLRPSLLFTRHAR